MRRDSPAGVPLPPSAHVFGDEIGQRIGNVRRAWQTAVLRAHGHKPVLDLEEEDRGEGEGGTRLSPESEAAYRTINLHFHDLRHEGGSRLLEAGWPVHDVQHMPGHASLQQTSTYLNATLGGLHESMRNLDQSRPACKQTRPRLRASSQAASRQNREVLPSLIVVVGGVDGTRTRGLRRDRPAF
jgi:Phage integrase family